MRRIWESVKRVCLLVWIRVAHRMSASPESPEYLTRLRDLSLITRDFAHAMTFVLMDSKRDPGFASHHLLSYVIHDVLESLFAVVALAREGASNSAKRELRYILELAIKVCLVEQEHPRSEIDAKIALARELLDSTNIGARRRIQLVLIPDELCDEFHEEVGRLYGSACSWVHVTVEQIEDRMRRLDREITAGKEGLQELNELIPTVERCYAAVLVLFLHSFPDWVVGDLLVEANGTSRHWHFEASRFISAIDTFFDYKAERAGVLDAVRTRRSSMTKF